jgi:hypothetical protein
MSWSWCLSLPGLLLSVMDFTTDRDSFVAAWIAVSDVQACKARLSHQEK